MANDKEISNRPHSEKRFGQNSNLEMNYKIRPNLFINKLFE